MKSALLIVDLQNDFLPKGALPVPKGDEIIEPINHLQKEFDLIVASKDWHPKGHSSFASSHGRKPYDKMEGQVLWPDHCVQGSFGAEFPKELEVQKIAKVFLKGSDPLIDSYSAFFDNLRKRSTGLDLFLKQERVEKLFVVGLATEYCVKYSVLDACMLGYETCVLVDYCRGINLMGDEIETAFLEMKKAGAKIVKGYMGFFSCPCRCV